MVVWAGPSVSQPSLSATMCWHSHICSHLCRIPVPVPCGTGAPCTRHTCCLPMLHCRSRGKTIHILATSCTNICGLGVPVPTHYFPGPLWSGFGIPACTLAKVPVQPTYTCCFSEPPHGGTGMPVCASTMPSTAFCYLRVPVFRAAVCQCSMAVHTSAVSLTAPCQLRLCAFCVSVIFPSPTCCRMGRPACTLRSPSTVTRQCDHTGLLL